MIDAMVGIVKFLLAGAAGFTAYELLRDWLHPVSRALRAWHRAVRRYGLHSGQACEAYSRYLDACRGR